MQQNEELKEKEIIKFDLNKYNKMIFAADDYFEAAERCSFNGSIKLGKYPLMIPNFTNGAFACELYLKATLYLIKNEIPKGHNLYKLFFKLNKRNRKDIYNIWRTIDEQDIVDCDYAEGMFCDNLEAISHVFTRFRYVHEWAGSTISLQTSFTENQMHFHYASLTRPFGIPQVSSGFLDQFAKSIKKYKNEFFKLKKY